MIKQEPNIELAQKIVDFLNELLEIDRPAIAALIANRVPCNQRMADHPTVQVGAQHGGFHVGLLGILNGLCGIHENGMGAIAAIFETHNEDLTPKQFPHLTRFEVLCREEE